MQIGRFAAKWWVALLEKGFSFDERHIKLCDQYPEGENIDKDYLAINPPVSYTHLTLPTNLCV